MSWWAGLPVTMGLAPGPAGQRRLLTAPAFSFARRGQGPCDDGGERAVRDALGLRGLTARALKRADRAASVAASRSPLARTSTLRSDAFDRERARARPRAHATRCHARGHGDSTRNAQRAACEGSARVPVRACDRTLCCLRSVFQIRSECTVCGRSRDAAVHRSWVMRAPTVGA